MKILITGGLGYLGEMIAKYFLEKNFDIRIYSLEKPDNEDKYKKYEIIQGDILDQKNLETAMNGVDYVIHLAAASQEHCENNFELALTANGIGTKNVLEAGEKAKVKRIVYFSTMHIYGNAFGKITEETIPNPITNYAIGKYLGEIYCRQFSDRVNNVVLRFSNASLGASSSKKGWNLVVNDLCKNCYLNQEIKLKSKGTQKRNFLSINDMLGALDIIINAKNEDVNGKLFNVGGEHILSIFELAEKILEVYQNKYKKTAHITVGEGIGMNKIDDFEYSFDKIKKLGYNPKSVLKDEIEKIFEMIENLHKAQK